MGLTKVCDDGLVVYGASGLGACSNALLYDRSGVTGEPPPDWLQKAYDQGNDNEQRIIDMLEAQGVFRAMKHDELVEAGYQFGEYEADRDKDYSDQVRVEAKLVPGVVCRAHLDGIGEMVVRPEGWTREQDNVGSRYVIEAKAFGDSYWQDFKKKGLAGFPGYSLQVTAQMKGAGLPCLFVVGHKGSDGVVFEIDYEFVDEPPVKWIDVIRKIGAIEARVNGTGEDIPCEQPLMYPCPFYLLHGPEAEKVGGEGIITLDDNNTDQQERVLLLSLAEEYERHQAAEKHHKELKAKAAADVAEWFDNRQMKGAKVSVGPYELEDYVGTRDGAFSAEKLGKVISGSLDAYRNAAYEVRWPKLKKKNADKGKGEKK